MWCSTSVGLGFTSVSHNNVNDICRAAVPGENIKLFADDTNLFIFDGDSDKLTQRANNCLKDLDNWFKANKLTLNLEKETS